MADDQDPLSDINGLSEERRALIRALGVDLEKLDPRTRAAVEAFSEEVLFLREAVAELKQSLADAEALADHDALCPVFNRRAFERELRREIALAERYGSPLCVIFADLNRFKAVNDAHGHAAGDAVLVSVAGALESNVRESDIVGRLGGDEFGLILPHASRPDCEAKARELAAAVHALKIEPDGSDGVIQPSASFGVAAWRRGQTAQDVLAAADEAMFARKTQVRQHAP